MDGRNATARSRELGDELKRARQLQGLKGRELARLIGWTETKISRVETGKIPCSEVDAAIYLAFCRVTPKELDRIVELCSGDEDGTWLRHHGEKLPDQLRTLVLHETTASAIYSLELNRIPGLLQTEDYARSMMREARMVPEPGIEPRVQARMERQILLKRRVPPEFTFYIHENALRLPVGGAQVMHEQMLHLLFVASRQFCSIQVVPEAAGAHAGLAGPFRLMQYTDQQPVICVETQNRSMFMESQTDIATYWLILGNLAEVALSVKESRSVLASYASRYDRTEASSHGDGVA
ncbi:Putative DNA-binding protein [Alloactinosynnema sp. L-07]|uniref:helix-turn-helix domain-containing protein n=1 Tax=Alloactinosynnema sp. L-07 TaxID=1653480 RepID=UPI00065EF044|nr:helix-turn-helix transcriptional regulator [Alloactinosynnema sp. L-07]CRK58511.1 Putative DNA-binding protein [Alloactinosynnema sp. L-07]